MAKDAKWPGKIQAAWCSFGYRSLPLALLSGLLSGYLWSYNPSLVIASLALVGGCLISLVLVARFPGTALVLLTGLSFAFGNLVTGEALVQAAKQAPADEDLGKSYRIQARIRHHWDTAYGSGISVDRIHIISPADVSFSLDRLTIYTPKLDRDLPRHGEMTAWIRLKRTYEPQTIAWPMRRLRDRHLPRYTGSVKDPVLMQLPDSEQPVGGLAALNQGNRELLGVFLQGRPSYLWRERLEPFGLGHLLAISGLHCIFVWGALQLLLWPIRAPWIRASLTVLGLLSFAHWVGWTASVTRAALMLSFWQILPGLNRPRSWLRLWTGLLLVTLLADPLTLMLRGFWYSFAASLGLILGARHLPESPLDHPWLKPMRKVLPIVSAQFFVIPINLMFDCRTSFSSLFWNMLGFALLFLLLGQLALCLASLLLRILIPLANALEELVAAGISLLSFEGGWEWIRFPHQPLTVLVVLVLLFLALSWQRREWRWYLAGTVLLLFGLLHRPLNGERLYMFDVGQGQCMLYVTDQGDGWLFDAGGRLPGSLDLNRLLMLCGVKHLRAAFVSHLNRDHYELLPDQALTVYVPEGQRHAFEAMPDLQHHDFVAVHAGQRFNLGSLQVETLWPSKEMTFPNSNEESLVLLLRSEHWSMMLTGDAGLWMEQRLETVSVHDRHLLQVGHHGSRSATGRAFLERIPPDVALISCGRHNRFGHPHPNVLNNLSQQGITTWSTAEQGSLVLADDGSLSSGIAPR